jgi:phosphatidylglycerol lysyltransferase
LTLKKRWSGLTQLEDGFEGVANVVNGVIPTAVSAVTFLSGVLLLVGSSVSLSAKTLTLLEDYFPLEIIELSHLLGGVVGMVLILLSFALWQRVRAALFLTSILFISGAVISFVQTLDYDRAVVLIIALLLLVLGKGQFYRRARLFSGAFNLKTFLVTLAALTGFLWLLFFSFKSTPYQHDLWWQFALNDQISRGFRTIVVAITTYIILYLFYALRPPKSHFELPDSEQLERAEKIVTQQHNADANFVFTGDKSLLWGHEDKAFIMFGIQRRRWISLGEPVGPEAEAYELLWQFKQQAEDSRCQAVFYQVGSEHLDWYINAGFNLFKLGEEAIINLQEFSLEGSNRSKLRQSHNRAKRDGLSFSITYPPHSPELLSQLKTISDEWLIAKKVREKGFSLGKFDNDYLNRFPLALIHEQGNLSAFANVLTTKAKQESTIDLMRHSNDASQVTMEFLFIELMLNLKEEGYTTFSLGMAPLSGLEDRKGARKWDKFGSLIYKNGADFYNFDGLRTFKNKFKPEWKPKYLAIKQGKNPYLTMIDIAALISGNIIGVIKK